MFPERIHGDIDPRLVCKFREIWLTGIGKVVRYLPHKKTKLLLAPALASARIAPKICQSQRQTRYSECPGFHPNPYTSVGVIAGHMDITETRHKVFPILGEASSPSKNYSLYTVLTATDQKLQKS